jgi:hypothetical protein
MRIVRVAIAAAAATITLITGAGASMAAVRAPASPHWTNGIEHFQIVGTTVSGKNNHIAAYGVFNASGIDHTISGHVDVFRFGNGSFLVTHKPTHTRNFFNKRTCAGLLVQRGVYRLSHGHGRYAGIRGHGRYLLHVLFVTRHTRHGCSRKPIAVHSIVWAHGPVSLP